MTSYEYRIDVADEPLTESYLQNEYGNIGFKLSGIVEFDGRFYYHFERQS